jgi:predicted DNA binding CopG/RHH family protein
MMKQKQKQRRYCDERKRAARIEVRVSKREYQSMKALAEQRGVSLSDLVRSVIHTQAQHQV